MIETSRGAAKLYWLSDLLAYWLTHRPSPHESHAAPHLPRRHRAGGRFPGALQFRARPGRADARRGSRAHDDLAARLQGHRFRRGAGRAKPDRHGVGRAGPAVGGGELHLRGTPEKLDLALRDRILIFEDGRRRRALRLAQSVQRYGADAHEHRAGPRRRVGDVPAAVALHPRCERRRRAGRSAAGGARWFHGAAGELSQLRQRPPLGARSAGSTAAAGTARRGRSGRRARPRRSASRCAAACGATTPSAKFSRRSPPAPRIRGGTIGTSTASCSSSTR